MKYPQAITTKNSWVKQLSDEIINNEDYQQIILIEIKQLWTGEVNSTELVNNLTTIFNNAESDHGAFPFLGDCETAPCRTCKQTLEW